VADETFASFLLRKKEDVAMSGNPRFY